MGKIILLNNDFVEASYVTEFKIAHIVWKTLNIPSANYREGLSTLLHYAKNHDILNFLSDGRENRAVAPEDRKWFQNYAVPEAEKLGLKHAAVIIKQDPFKKYYLNAILKIVNRKTSYDMKIFYDYDKALDWLKSFDDYH